MDSELIPVIVIDTRENKPLVFGEGYRAISQCLPVGDYGCLGFSDWQNPAFIVERKSLGDLTNSLGGDRPRFMREIEKMRQFGFRALVIEASPDDLHCMRSAMSPQSIFGTLDALSVRTGLHVFWAGDADGAARQVESLVRQFVRGIIKNYELLQETTEEAAVA